MYIKEDVRLSIQFFKAVPTVFSAPCSATRSLAPKHNWMDDLCHLPTNRCNSTGYLTELVLADMGLKCKEFPSDLGDLEALRRLDFSNNRLVNVTFKDVADVRHRGGLTDATCFSLACHSADFTLLATL
jgi:hypothetical protein